MIDILIGGVYSNIATLDNRNAHMNGELSLWLSVALFLYGRLCFMEKIMLFEDAVRRLRGKDRARPIGTDEWLTLDGVVKKYTMDECLEMEWEIEPELYTDEPVIVFSSIERHNSGPFVGEVYFVEVKQPHLLHDKKFKLIPVED